MTVAERFIEQGRLESEARGEARGEALGIEKALKSTMKLFGLEHIKNIGLEKLSTDYGLPEEKIGDIYKEVEAELKNPQNTQ